MDFILDNIIWLLAAAAGIVQWWKSTQEAKAERALAEEIRRRRMEEATDGYEEEPQYPRTAPRPAVPPPLPASGPPAIPPQRRAGRSVPEGIPVDFPEPSGELARQQALAEQVRELKKTKRNREGGGMRVTRPAVPQKAGPAPSSLRARLSNKRELRQAFVLKEILDRPVGLR